MCEDLFDNLQRLLNILKSSLIRVYSICFHGKTILCVCVFSSALYLANMGETFKIDSEQTNEVFYFIVVKHRNRNVTHL